MLQKSILLIVISFSMAIFLTFQLKEVTHTFMLISEYFKVAEKKVENTAVQVVTKIKEEANILKEKLKHEEVEVPEVTPAVPQDP